MTRRTEPEYPFTARPFATATAVSGGMTLGQLRSSAFQRSYYGVRSVGLDLDVVEHRARAYAARMVSGGAFSHSTAALLWKMPLPLSLADASDLHVSVSPVGRAPRGKSVVGHSSAGLAVVWRATLPTTSAVATWCDLAGMLFLHDLVAVGEYIVTGDPFNDVLPLATIDELRAATALRAGSPGQRNRDAALRLIREGALSRPETLVRLLLVQAGMPQPLINFPVEDARGSFLAMPDLAWPDYLFALEYEGDLHRSVRRFRSDIRRIERLVDHGWVVMKVTANDLFDRPSELAERVARRLVSRGWVAGGIRLPQNVRFAR